MWHQMKRIAVFNVKNQDTLHGIVLTLGAMNATNMVISPWTAHREYLLPEHQWHITRHTKVIMPDWAWGTTVKIKTGKANPDHSSTTEDIPAQVIIIHIEATLEYWGRCSHHRSSSWQSHLPHRGHSHRPHHDTLHQSHLGSSTHHSSLGYPSWDHSRSHSWPSYQSSRHESCRSHSYSSRMRRRPHHKNMKVKIEDPHIITTAQMITAVTQERNHIFKLIELSPSSDSHEQGGLP